MIFQKIKNRIKLYRDSWLRKRFIKETYPLCFSNDVILIQDVDKLFMYQYNNIDFNRYDLIVRYLAIEYMYNKNDFGKSLYEKMQLYRRGKVLTKNDWENFEKLVKSIEINNYDYNKPIYIDKNQFLKDGSHRLSVQLYFSNKYIPILMSKRSFNINYDINWFKKYFNTDEIKIIENKLNNTIKDKELYFIVFLWSPVSEFFNDIKKDISKKYIIIEENLYRLDNHLEEFVYDIYSTDDVTKDKIKLKLKKLSFKNNLVQAIKINIGNPKFRKKLKTNTDISVVIEELKEFIRNTYKNKIDYHYDNIIHISDNYNQTKELNKLLEKYKEYKVNV